MKNSYLWFLLRAVSRIIFYVLYLLRIKIYSLKEVDFIIITPGKTGSSSLQVNLSINGLKSHQLHRINKAGLVKSLERDIRLYKGISKHLYVSWCIQENLTSYKGIYLMPFRSVLSRDISSVFQNSDGLKMLTALETDEILDKFLEKRYYQNAKWLSDLTEWIEDEIYEGFKCRPQEFPARGQINEITVLNSNRLICFDVNRSDDVMHMLGLKNSEKYSNISSNKYYSSAYNRSKERIDKSKVIYSYDNDIVKKWI